jgi:hypothetical protein
MSARDSPAGDYSLPVCSWRWRGCGAGSTGPVAPDAVSIFPARALPRSRWALRVAAEPDHLEFLDKGLRTLGLALATWTRPLPAVAGARLTEDGLELLLAAAAPDAPGPFFAADDDRVWVLARDASLPDPHTIAGLLCPLPPWCRSAGMSAGWSCLIWRPPG